MQETPDPPACATCRYYCEREHGIGACHRYPPVFAGDHTPREFHRWSFPLVGHGTWCGEHRLP